MREMERCAKHKRHKPIGTKRQTGAAIAPNLLNREEAFVKPNAKWVSDTTYVWTTEGWL
jgi:transposase InsO family protein